MPNKKISEFPTTTTLAGNAAFLINHLGTTSTVAFSSLSAAVTNDSVKLPSGATGGQVLTYNGSTTTWVASAAPRELPQTATGGQVLTYNGTTSTWVASAAPDQSTTGSIVAWVNFDATRNAAGASDDINSNRFIRASNNVNSVTKTDTGTFLINFINPIIDNNYIIIANASLPDYDLLTFINRGNSTLTAPPSANKCSIKFGAANVGYMNPLFAYVSITR